MNPSDASSCAECHENLLQESDLAIIQSASKEGTHWFWAFLVMVCISWLGRQLCLALFASNPYRPSFIALFIAELIVLYISLFVWLRLTARRYIRAGIWTFFSYLWYIVGPFSLYSNYIIASRYIDGDNGFFAIAAIICSVFGVLYLGNYRKKIL